MSNHITSFLLELYSKQKLKMILFTFNSFILVLISLIIPLAIKYGIDNMNTENLLDFSFYFMPYIIIGILCYLSLKLSNIYLDNYLVVKSNELLRKKINQSIRKANIFYLRSNKSNISQLLINDVPYCQGIYNSILLNLLMEAIVFIITLGLLFTLNFKLTMILFLFIPLNYLLYSLYNIKIRNNSILALEKRDELSEISQRIFLNLNLYKISYEPNPLEKEYYNTVDKMAENQMKRGMLFGSLSISTTLLYFLMAGLVLLLGLRDINNEIISLGEYVAFVLYIFRFFPPIKNIADYVVKYKTSVLCVDRVINFLSLPKEEERQVQDVCFKNFDVHLDNAELNIDNKQIFSKVNGTFLKGRINILKGSNAAGKTSLILSLLKLYNGKNIYIDGVEIKDIPNHILRENIGVVFQTNEFLTKTVIEEIELSKSQSNYCNEYIKIVIQDITDSFLRRNLPNTEIKSLSGGKKQLLSILCQINKAPKILILDEAMSNLDIETKNEINELLHILKDHINIIVIEHGYSESQGKVIRIDANTKELEVVT